MGTNYYLSRGYNIENYKKCYLTKIYDNLKSIEEIDIFTSKYYNYDDLRNVLLHANLINVNEDIVIATYKTDKKTKVKKLIPIYQKKLIFKEDLEMLGFHGKNYQELASELWEYIKNNQNNLTFMNYILKHYIEKYEESTLKVKAPIYTSGYISAIARIINKPNKNDIARRIYMFCFTNFFKNEIYKCERIYKENKDLGENFNWLFVPIDKKINKKGFHDLLLHIIYYHRNYVNKLEEKKEKQLSIDSENEHEEFLENSDFERLLENYAKNRQKYDLNGNAIIGEINPLNIYDNTEIEKDDYAAGIISDQQKLVKK